MPRADLLLSLDRQSPWPIVRVGRRPSEDGAEDDVIGERTANIGLLGNERVLLDRRAGSAMLAANGASDDGRFVHPFLTVAATVFAWWHGNDAFHAGAFVANGEAWAVLGDRGAGKSSQLAAMMLAGHSVLTDDLLVVRNLTAFVGPRCIDLRPDAADALNLTASGRRVRSGERVRLPHAGAPAELPLGGFIFLSWGPGPVLRAMGPSERFEQLIRHKSLPSSSQGAVLSMAQLPAWELRRPPEWPSVERAAVLLGELAS